MELKLRNIFDLSKTNKTKKMNINNLYNLTTAQRKIQEAETKAFQSARSERLAKQYAEKMANVKPINEKEYSEMMQNSHREIMKDSVLNGEKI